MDGRFYFGEVLDAKGKLLFIDPQHPRLRPRPQPQQWTATGGVWTTGTTNNRTATATAPGIHYVQFRNRSF